MRKDRHVRLTPHRLALAAAPAPGSTGAAQELPKLKPGRLYRISCTAEVALRVGGDPTAADLRVLPLAPFEFVADAETVKVAAASTTATTYCFLQEEP